MEYTKEFALKDIDDFIKRSEELAQDLKRFYAWVKFEQMDI